MIYLDYNATAPVRAEALAAMHDVGAQCLGNPSSVHHPGRRARMLVEECRRTLAETIGADPREVHFTSGGTESNNWALFGAAKEWDGRHLVVSPIEHSSVVQTARALERHGARVSWLPVDADGRIAPSSVAAALSDDTTLVSIGWANNEIGTVQTVREIGDLCRSRNVPLHVDAVQALGKLPLHVGWLTLCSLSAHKIGGPQGVGALFVRHDFELQPFLCGGAQERGMRPGTENVAGLAGFSAALKAIRSDDVATERLRERLWQGLSALGGVRRNSPGQGCLANTLHVSFNDLRGEALVAALDLEGVAVSVGSACAAGSAEASHVLLAIGRTAEEAQEGIRFSLGDTTTVEEIDATVAALRRVVARMRGALLDAPRSYGHRLPQQALV